MNYLKYMSRSAACNVFIYLTSGVKLPLQHSGQFQTDDILKNLGLQQCFFSPWVFSLTTKCPLKCRLKFNPRLETHLRHLRHTWASACKVKSRAEVYIFLPDLNPNGWECKLVWVTYWDLEDKLGRPDLKEASVFGSMCCSTVGFFLACPSVSFIIFFCYPFAWVQNAGFVCFVREYFYWSAASI